MIDFGQIQDRIYENKSAKGFNMTNVEKEFNMTYGELAEAYDAWRKARTDVGAELADVFIYLLSLARMTGVDLEAEVEAKLSKNEQGAYKEHEINGRRVRLKEPPADHPAHNQKHEGGHHG